MTDQQIKDAVRERDGQRCVDCGMTADEHISLYGKTLDVHRKVPGSEYSVDGCETVCKRCHGPREKLPAGTYPKNLRYVALPIDLWQQLKNLADSEDRSISATAKRIVKKFFSEQPPRQAN